MVSAISYFVGILALIQGTYGYLESQYVTHQSLSVLFGIFGLVAIGVGALFRRDNRALMCSIRAPYRFSLCCQASGIILVISY